MAKKKQGTWVVEIRDHKDNVLGDVLYGEVLKTKPTPEELEALYLRAKVGGWEHKEVVFVVKQQTEEVI